MDLMTGDNSGNPATHLGRQMKRDRLAHGWSLRELAARTGINFAHLGRIELGTRPPTEKIALACDAVFPERDGWYLTWYEESKSWTSPGFRSFTEYENRARNLRVWSPGVTDGLLQVEPYAHAMLSTAPEATPEIVATRLANRLERQQRILYRDDPPNVWFVVDEVALFRYVASPEVMTLQCAHLADVAMMPNVQLQILPCVAHPANASELIITDDAAYVEHQMGGLVYTDGPTCTSLARLFASIQGESNKTSDSLTMIKRMEATWNRSGLRATATTGRRASRPRVTME